MIDAPGLVSWTGHGEGLDRKSDAAASHLCHPPSATLGVHIPRPSMVDVSSLSPDSRAAADFVLDVLAVSAEAPFGRIDWAEINRLAARWLRPDDGDTSRMGHALVMEMAAEGLVEAEVTLSADGGPLVSRVVHPRFLGLQAAQRLAA